MFVGVSPFFDLSENKMIQNILKCEYSMPTNVPEEAQSLIKQLLVLDCEARLGADNINSLRNHPYFRVIDWHRLHLMKAPFWTQTPFVFNNNREISEQQFFIEPRINEVKIQTEEVEETQEIIVEQPVQAKIIQESEINERIETEVEKDEPISPIVTESQIQTKHQEEQILKGIILKKCGWVFYQPRLVILYDSKKIRYFHPSQRNLKGEIILTKNLKVEKTKKDAWQITTPQRIYQFQVYLYFLCDVYFVKDYEKSVKADEWVTKINEIIEQLE